MIPITIGAAAVLESWWPRGSPRRFASGGPTLACDLPAGAVTVLSAVPRHSAPDSAGPGVDVVPHFVLFALSVSPYSYRFRPCLHWMP